MSNEEKRLALFQHPLNSPAVFSPETLLEAVGAGRNLPQDPVSEVCVLEFDGGLTDWLVETGHAKKWLSWA